MPRPDREELLAAALAAQGPRRLAAKPDMARKAAERQVRELLAAWPAQPPRERTAHVGRLVVVDRAWDEPREVLDTDHTLQVETAGLVLTLDAKEDGLLHLRLDTGPKHPRMRAERWSYSEIQATLDVRGLPWEEVAK